VLAELKRKGLIRHLGVSNVTPEQLDEAQKIADIVCVQNFYNVANRNDDAFIDRLVTEGIPYVPFFRWEDSRRYSRCLIGSHCV
jgi:aryl-alcohol dehydrogenase-like predicted oxidoreductase